VTLWTGGLSALLNALCWITRSSSESSLADWTTFVTFVFSFCAFWLIFRWARKHIMWRLRYRLIITYIFIGVIPIVLLLAMVGLGNYLFAGQFATYVAISNLQSSLHHLETANDALATRLDNLDRSGKLDKQINAEPPTIPGENLAQRSVTVWKGEEGFTLSDRGTLVKASPEKSPDAIKGDFSGFVIDGSSLHLRAVKRAIEDATPLTVISDLPITAELLQSATSNLGSVTLIPPDKTGVVLIALTPGAGPDENIVVNLVPSKQLGDLQIPPPSKTGPSGLVQTKPIPPSSNRFDPTFHFLSAFDALNWETGKSQTCGIVVVTRPSILYSTLFATMGGSAKVIQYGMLMIAILFGLVELVALFIGIRLSRGMTRAVADLYGATEHVNRGDLTYRIQIRGHDQMAALEQSFNSMTESLVTLVAEQKQMQRLESEVAIAYEVQNMLFPCQFPELASLDVYGVCRPARSVSGDYYDFIPLGSDNLVLAVGDISGKGISAALLMAAAHAFVRAYSMEQDMVSTPVAMEAGTRSNGDHRIYIRGGGATQSRLSPGRLMTTLNYQLFRCSPPEKYATMFLGCYDAAARELTYCNAGHLPPILLSENGRVSRLDTSGTVVGLFDGAIYSESTVMMQSGDLFIAFSDGVTEPENDSGEFGEDRLIALIQEHRDQPLSRIGDLIASSVADWIGNAEQPDDVTVVLARAR
jgi:sigma-B regulation protein RsbU (phosphoserine phosphatase)